MPFLGETEHTLEIGRFSLFHTSPGINDKEGGGFSQRLPQLRDKSLCFTSSVDWNQSTATGWNQRRETLRSMPSLFIAGV